MPSGSIREEAERLRASAWEEGYKAGMKKARDELSDSPFSSFSVKSNPYGIPLGGSSIFLESPSAGVSSIPLVVGERFVK